MAWGCLATGCADACLDDGLGQSRCDLTQVSDTDSAVAETEGAGTGSTGLVELETDGNLATQGGEGASQGQEGEGSGAGSEGTSGSGSASQTEGGTVGASETEGDTASGGASETEGATATGGASETEGATATGGATATASGTAGASETGDDGGTASASGTGDGGATGSASMTDGGTASATGGMATGGSETGDDDVIFCLDADGDGFGDPTQCEAADPDDPPEDSVPESDGLDCDDGSATTFPGAAPLDDPEACMADEDGDDFGDNTPPDGVVPGTDCDDTVADVQICALLVTQDGTADLAYDEGLVDSLESLGLRVTLLEDTAATPADATGMTVVVVSETAHSTDVADTFRNVEVPVVSLEGLIWDDMSLAPEGASINQSTVVIADATSPLAAGLTGSVVVVSGNGAGLFVTTPPASASIVALGSGPAMEVAYFAIEAGAAMVDGFEAPARRVGLGLDADRSEPSTALLTEDGLALFEAAVTWAIGG